MLRGSSSPLLEPFRQSCIDRSRACLFSLAPFEDIKTLALGSQSNVFLVRAARPIE